MQGKNAKNNTSGSEGTPVTVSGLGSGKGLIIAGSMTSIVGALLLKKGFDTRKQIQNKQGDIVADIGLPESGDMGVSVKF